MGELQKQIETLGLDPQTKQKISQILNQAAEEFPYLACPSKDDCNNFNWYKKWFNQK